MLKNTSRFLIILATYIFLYVSTYHLPFIDSIKWVNATDAYSYLEIARSVPSFPVDFLPYHFAQRWIPHYLVGQFAHLPNLDYERAYILTSIILCLGIFWVTLDVLLKICKDSRFAILLFFLSVLSPFTFRLFIFVPVLLTDLVFMLGIAVTLRGLVIHRLVWVIVGMVAATCGKQMSLLILPGVFLYTWSCFGGIIGFKRALLASSSVLTATIFTYLFLIKTSANFSLPNSITSNVLFAIFRWIPSNEFSSHLLAEHFLRILLPLVPFIGFLLIGRRNLAHESRVDKNSLLSQLLILENLALLLMVLGPIAYAFLPGPQVQMGNQSRYIGLIFLPFAMLVARLGSNIHLQLNTIAYIVLGLLLCLYSYHHRYTVLQAGPSFFLLVHIATLFGLMLWFMHYSSPKLVRS